MQKKKKKSEEEEKLYRPSTCSAPSRMEQVLRSRDADAPGQPRGIEDSTM